MYDDDYRPYYRVYQPPSFVSSLEERAQVAADVALEMRVRLERAKKFGKDADYDKDDAFLFHRTYYEGGPEYTWVAVKVADNKWFITGRVQVPRTFEQLVEEYLIESSDVWVCTAWKEL